MFALVCHNSFEIRLKHAINFTSTKSILTIVFGFSLFVTVDTILFYMLSLLSCPVFTRVPVVVAPVLLPAAGIVRRVKLVYMISQGNNLQKNNTISFANEWQGTNHM